MKQYDIKTGNLYTDLDTFYDKENNKIDVYSSVYWTAESEEEYLKKAKLIDAYGYKDDLMEVYAWYDVSGYDYWVIQQQEENYVSIDVLLKKMPEEYTQEEIEKIRDVIIEANQYFEKELI